MKGCMLSFVVCGATGAQREDFDKVAELDVLEVEDDLQEYDAGRLRELQMELLELSFEDQWGTHLFQVREAAQTRALSFVRSSVSGVCCRARGFTKPMSRNNNAHSRETATRREGLSALAIDSSTISSVVSNVSARMKQSRWQILMPRIARLPTRLPPVMARKSTNPRPDYDLQLRGRTYPAAAGQGSVANSTSAVAATSNGGPKEQPILTLFPLEPQFGVGVDGTLMLLNQTPITAETNKLAGTLVSEYGLED
ncbi:hypothetical protein QC762_0029330 [Podospora pseudocomata]|uniref:Uncharacterized protein n=1 Tax=Podospora pseudocomata TaxID=2093779 RepID=A0ABR0GS30_9PEZI|nr:hypothetical protein QC762_0029330 [Podospora pseudocomata]